MVATASQSSGVRTSLHLRAEDGEQDAEEAVDAHLGHGAGEQDGGSGGSFGVGGGQPGVEGNERDFDGEAEEGSGEEQQGEVLRREAVPGELGDDGGHELAGLRECGEVDEVEFVGREEDGEEGQQHGDAADHGVDEELGGGLGAARASPERMRKNAGMRPSSQKMNQWKKLSAVKVPKRQA